MSDEVKPVLNYHTGEALDRRVTQLESDLSGTDRAVATHNDRISAVESKVEDLRQRIDALEGHPRRSSTTDILIDPSLPEGMAVAGFDEFSLPIGRGVPAFPKTSTHLVTRDQVQRGAYNDGYLAGQNSMVEAKNEIEEQAIRLAISRVTGYMTANLAYSEAMLGGVVRAIRGEVTVVPPED